jgi:hypothetical protein
LSNVTDELREQGYVQFKAISEEESTLEIATRIGAVSPIPGISPVQQLIPRAADQTSANSYGGIYGLGHFPLHTDMAHWYIPPHYFLLRCMEPAPDVKTLVLHSRFVFADEDEVTLRRALFRPRRRLGGRLTCLRLYESGRYRWDANFITPMSKSAIELRERIIQRAQATKPKEISLNTPMDCIVLDNWSVLHARTAVSLQSIHRNIERVYLDSVYI